MRKVNIGETVCLSRFDQYERPVNKLGPCIVVKIESDRCESGEMITIRTKSGKVRRLDRNWLRELKSN